MREAKSTARGPEEKCRGGSTDGGRPVTWWAASFGIGKSASGS